jgi:hypothetical protein
MKTCIPVTKYQTFDGKSFDTEKKAKEYIEDLIQENLHIFPEIAQMLEYGEE